MIGLVKNWRYITVTKTVNYGLTHFEPQDHPDFLTDYNRDMEIIDQILSELQDNIGLLRDENKELKSRCDRLQGQIDNIVSRL